MGKLSNFLNLFKHNSSSQSNDDKIISEHESIDINLEDNSYNLNQIEGNKDINMLKEQRGSNYILNNTPSNESDLLKLFKYDSIMDSSKTFNIETALNNNWDKIDTFATNVSSKMEDKANKQFKQHNSLNTIGWKRIASCNNYNTFGTFTIYNNYNTAQPNVFEVNVIKNYGNRASIIQTNATIGGDNIISKIRMIHDNTKAYLEIYYTKSIENNIYVTLENFKGWVLLNVIEEGSIPSGYNVQELTIVDKGMSINDRPVATLVDLEEKAGKDLLQFKNANFKLPADLPNSYPNGFSAFYGSATDWGVGVVGANYGAIVETFKFSNGYSRQTISSTPAFPIKYRTSGTNNVWGTWQEIATSADMEHKADKIDTLAVKGILNDTTFINIPTSYVGRTTAGQAINMPFAYGGVASFCANDKYYGLRLAWDVANSNLYFQTAGDMTYDGLPWKEIATTEKIDISSALVNGWTLYSSSYPVIVTKSGNIINMSAFIRNGTITKGTILFTLPVGYRPQVSIFTIANQYSNPVVPRLLRIDPNGNVRIETDYDWVTGTYNINCSFSA